MTLRNERRSGKPAITLAEKLAKGPAKKAKTPNSVASAVIKQNSTNKRGKR